MSLAATMRSVLGSERTDKSVHAQALMKVVETATTPEERVELLAIALAERDEVPKNTKSLPNKGIDEDKWDQLVKTHSEIIDGHLKMSFFRTRAVKDFAAELLRLIDFFTEEDEKVFALAKMLFSPYVPYLQLPGVPAHMTSSEYKHKLSSDEKRVRLIEYIQALPFDERTERASMLLQVIDDTQDKDLRVALLAHANFRLESKVMKRVREELEG